MTLPQPREGIVGTLRDQDDLLSLAEEAQPRRLAMMELAWHLHGATLVGDPAPAVKELGDRIRKPQPGDLVMETTSGMISRSDADLRCKAFGILLEHRTEWAQTDEEFMADEESRELNPGWRAKDDAWYVQYGPQPDDICRWYNCMFIAVPIDRDFGTL